MTQASKLASVYSIDDFVERFNAQPDAVRWAKKHGRPKYERWKVRRILKAMKVEVAQEISGEGTGKRGTNIYVTHRALERATGGDLINSLLDIEALNDEEALSGANHGGAGL